MYDILYPTNLIGIKRYRSPSAPIDKWGDELIDIQPHLPPMAPFNPH